MASARNMWKDCEHEEYVLQNIKHASYIYFSNSFLVSYGWPFEQTLFEIYVPTDVAFFMQQN
jgi:hypothetical protein